MSKIKRIEISDFRIYEGKEDFDFEVNNGIANLVALYAPNGFGKTSFFDAIEWSFSNEIKRFENSFIKKAIKDEQEDTILLTNSYSYKKGLKGKVKIITDTDSFLEKTVQRYKKPGVDFYNDYRQGILSDGAIQKDLTEIPETNILTQDQIDAFLRFKTPEEKFAALQEFWPQSEDATNRLKQLSELHNVVLKNINITDTRLIDVKTQLEDLSKDNKNITQINLWLQKVKDQKAYECIISIEKIDNTINQESYNIIYDENLRNIKGVALKIDKVELIKNELSRLNDELDKYISDSKLIESQNKKLVQLQNRKSNFLNLKQSKELKQSVSDEIATIKQRIDKYKYLDSHIIDYKSNVKKIEDLKNENQLSLSKNTRVLNHLQIIKESISNFIKHEKQFNQTRLTKEEQQSNVDRQYDEFFIINEKLKGQKNTLPDLKLKISGKDLDIAKLQKSNQVFDKIINEKDYPDTILLENQNYLEACKALKEITESINKLELEIALKQKELSKSGSLNENLDKIILFGEDYITETNASDCPLCKTTFETFEGLIERVKLEKKDTLKLSEQKNKISEIFNEISESQKTEVVFIERLKNVILSEMLETSKKITLFQEDKNKLINQVNDINNTIRILEFELKNCTDFFNNIFDNTIIIDKLEIDSIKKNLSEEVIVLNLKAERLKKIMNAKESILLEKEIKLSTNQSKVQKNNNSIESIQAQQTFQKTTQILNELNINNSQLEKNLITEQLSIDEKELSDKSESFSLLSKELKSIEKNIANEILKIDEANLDSTTYDTENLIKSCKENIEHYITKFNKYITSKEITLNVIKDNQLKNQNNLDDLLLLRKDLNALSIDLELIKENIRRNELENELENLNSILPRLHNSSIKIDAAKKDCMSYVQTGINNYFNKEVINEVYSRIEPHPKLTKIYFSTDFNDKGEPRLLIKTGNTDEEVNPVLFLSAGQVNVLSLSIFLAKAFEYGNETIETIFMDDPIQNLSDINVLSFIDLLRTLISTHNKQIVISTHDEKFFRLLQSKLPEKYCNTKYFEFESEGKLKKDNLDKKFSA